MTVDTADFLMDEMLPMRGRDLTSVRKGCHLLQGGGGIQRSSFGYTRSQVPVDVQGDSRVENQVCMCKPQEELGWDACICPEKNTKE